MFQCFIVEVIIYMRRQNKKYGILPCLKGYLCKDPIQKYIGTYMLQKATNMKSSLYLWKSAVNNIYTIKIIHHLRVITSIIFLMVAPCLPMILPMRLLCASILRQISCSLQTFLASSSITSRMRLQAALQFSG